MKTYEDIRVEVIDLALVDIIRTSGEDDGPVDVENGDTPAINIPTL